jgi:hypothetical protein
MLVTNQIIITNQSENISIDCLLYLLLFKENSYYNNNIIKSLIINKLIYEYIEKYLKNVNLIKLGSVYLHLIHKTNSYIYLQNSKLSIEDQMEILEFLDSKGLMFFELNVFILRYYKLIKLIIHKEKYLKESFEGNYFLEDSI